MVIGIIGESRTGKFSCRCDRFAQRIGGELPAPIAAMLGRKDSCFDPEKRDIHALSCQYDPDAVCEALQRSVNSL